MRLKESIHWFYLYLESKRIVKCTTHPALNPLHDIRICTARSQMPGARRYLHAIVENNYAINIQHLCTGIVSIYTAKYVILIQVFTPGDSSKRTRWAQRLLTETRYWLRPKHTMNFCYPIYKVSEESIYPLLTHCMLDTLFLLLEG